MMLDGSRVGLINLKCRRIGNVTVGLLALGWWVQRMGFRVMKVVLNVVWILQFGILHE